MLEAGFLPISMRYHPQKMAVKMHGLFERRF